MGLDNDIIQLMLSVCGSAVSDKNNQMITLSKQSLGLPSSQLGIEDL
jgi:hypothetical protein